MIRVDIDLNSTSFRFFFRPGEMEPGSYLLTQGDLVEAAEFEDTITDLC